MMNAVVGRNGISGDKEGVTRSLLQDLPKDFDSLIMFIAQYEFSKFSEPCQANLVLANTCPTAAKIGMGRGLERGGGCGMGCKPGLNLDQTYSNIGHEPATNNIHTQSIH